MHLINSFTSVLIKDFWSLPESDSLSLLPTELPRWKDEVKMGCIPLASATYHPKWVHAPCNGRMLVDWKVRAEKMLKATNFEDWAWLWIIRSHQAWRCWTSGHSPTPDSTSHVPQPVWSKLWPYWRQRGSDGRQRPGGKLDSSGWRNGCGQFKATAGIRASCTTTQFVRTIY